MPEGPAPFDRDREAFRPEWGRALRGRRARKRRLRGLAAGFPAALLVAIYIGDFVGPVPVAAVLAAYLAVLALVYSSLRSFPCPRCAREYCAQDADSILQDREDLECARCGLPNPAAEPRRD